MAKGIKGSGSKEDAPARTTIFIKPSKMRKLKYIALVGNNTLTGIVETLLSGYISEYEKKNGEIKV